jgi:hypothetical protein
MNQFFEIFFRNIIPCNKIIFRLAFVVIQILKYKKYKMNNSIINVEKPIINILELPYFNNLCPLLCKEIDNFF